MDKPPVIEAAVERKIRMGPAEKNHMISSDKHRMRSVEARLDKLGLKLPGVLLPQKKGDMQKWSVIACDQFTSQPEYWKKVEGLVGNSPSTLKLILPEAYLEKHESELEIDSINRTMQKYVEDKILIPQGRGFIYVERSTPENPSRKGLVVAFDLEMYDYSADSASMIRSTEGTVTDRLPPRIKIRENALLELPHILVLIDDPGKTVIEPLAEKVDLMRKLYDFPLMMGGGNIKGYHVIDTGMLDDIASALEMLADKDSFLNKYNTDPKCPVLLYAVGDGNHSLAAAKAFWENKKKSLSPADRISHPARYAMAELINVHNDGIKFEPIHRVVTNVDPVMLLESAGSYFNDLSGCSIMSENDIASDNIENIWTESSSFHIIVYQYGDTKGFICVNNPAYQLETGTLQAFLDVFLSKNKEAKIDYIHGKNTVLSLSAQKNSIGFLLPAMDKSLLFKTVIKDGVLPRKTFSMGEAHEKRYYLECRKIR